jgi:hypothetical protein
MPPFWGRTDGEIFDRVLHEPLDLNIEPWPDVSDSAKDLVAKCAQLLRTWSPPPPSGSFVLEAC